MRLNFCSCLFHYIGRIKYFTLISIPLIYYLFTFEGYFGNIFSQLVLHNPVAFGVSYNLIFSATKIGALLFSLAFWTASSLVTNEGVRKSSLIVCDWNCNTVWLYRNKHPAIQTISTIWACD